MTTIREEITQWLRTEARERGEGALMPTIAEVCEKFGVGGVETVRAGYRPLLEAGYIEVIQRPQRRWRVVTVPPAGDADAARLRELVDALVAEVAAVQARVAQLSTELMTSEETQA